MQLQPYTKNYRKIWNVERGRNNLLQGCVQQLPIQYQWSAVKKKCSNSTKHIEYRLFFMCLGIYMYTHMSM